MDVKAFHINTLLISCFMELCWACIVTEIVGRRGKALWIVSLFVQPFFNETVYKKIAYDNGPKIWGKQISGILCLVPFFVYLSQILHGFRVSPVKCWLQPNRPRPNILFIVKWQCNGFHDAREYWSKAAAWQNSVDCLEVIKIGFFQYGARRPEEVSFCHVLSCRRGFPTIIVR